MKLINHIIIDKVKNGFTITYTLVPEYYGNSMIHATTIEVEVFTTKGELTDRLNKLLADEPDGCGFTHTPKSLLLDQKNE